jgi:long-chain acyl-CoA synthetase
MNLAVLLEESAAKNPLKTAAVEGKQKISYGRLNATANQLASYLLLDLNLSRGSRIGILQENSIDYLITFFAIQKAGMIAVPINVFLKPDEVCYILNDCESTVLITSGRFYNVLDHIRQKSDTLEEIVITDKDAEGFKYLYQIIKKHQHHNHNIDIEDNQTAVISYTSSTTGSPKGAMLTHGNLISNARASMQTIEISGRDRILLAFPAFHSFMMTVCVILPIAAGAKIIILDSIKPIQRFLKTIIFKKVTLLIGIPQVFKVFVTLRLPFMMRLLFKFKSLKLTVSGSAPLDRNVAVAFEKKIKVRLREGYGLTEASPVVSLNPPSSLNKVGTVGLPLVGVEVKVVDNEEVEVPRNTVGELIVRGPNVMRGYYNMPEETAEVLKGGWLFTGDLAKIDEDGYITIVDRKKDLVISHGMNIYPREIEEVIELNFKVKEVAVIGVKDEHRGEVPIAVVVAKEGQAIEPREVIAYCKPRLANYKIPHRVEIRTDLPKTPTGKILKRVLRQEYQ